MKKKKTRMMAVVMALTVAITGVMPLPFTESREAKATGYGISNPVTNSDGVTTWDCVYFGNYYQSSVDVKEPIKWRVLSVEGDDAFLLADRVLDRQYYHTSRSDDITWSTSLVRSWLNGYSSNSNLCGTDYSEDNFIDTAFNQSEQQAIYTTRVVNDDNPNYEVDGGSDTWDKIYLLSINEAGNNAYGFQSEFEQSSDTRKVYDTAYADNSDLDEYSKSNVDWWLRSPGGLTCGASFVKSSGAGVIIGAYVDSRAGVRPALHLDLSSFAWRNAGKVGSDGSGVMPMPTENPYVSQSPIVTATPFSTGNPSTNRRQVSNPIIDSEGVTTWDCVYFGNYYQSDAYTKEPIKWRVLSVEGDDAFLLADQNLDAKPYHNNYENVTWEGCTLRSWLNGYSSSSNLSGVDYSSDNFLDTAFTDEEQSAICNTLVINEDNSFHGTEGGNDTLDKIYLLSIAEASNPEYGFLVSFNQNSDTRIAANTIYAEEQGACTNSDTDAGYWRLRSPGFNAGYASDVSYNGYGSIYGYIVNDDEDAVRPALRLNLLSSVWHNAGKVSSDGTIIEESELNPSVSQEPTDNPASYPTKMPTSSPTEIPTMAPSVSPSTSRRQVLNPIINSDGVTTWDCVYFGNYYQSNAYTKEPIKWRVLSVEGDEAFLLADQNLDVKPYHNNVENVTWEGCTLRSWLNGYGSSSNLSGIDYYNDNFLDIAFTDEEQSVICNTLVVNEDNPSFYETEGGNDTVDKIYLLSIAEASNPEYGFSLTFNQDSDTRIAINTVYAKEQGVYTDSDADAGYWWLRSPGGNALNALYVDSYGYGYIYGSGVDNYSGAVRPALHLNLSSSLWRNAGKVSSDGTMIEESVLNPDVSQGPTSEPTSEPTSAPEESPTARPSTAPATVPSADPGDLPTASPTLPPAGSPTWWTSKPSMSPSPLLKPSQTKRPSTTTISYDADDDEENYLYSTATTKKSKLKRGQTFTIRKMKYKVTKVNGNGSGELSLIGTTYKKTSRTFTSLKIGSTVTIQGYPCKITAVGNRAFRGYKKLKSITIGKNIRSIGKSAFSSCSGVRKLVIQTMKLTLKTVGSHAFALKAHVKPSMPKKKKKAYMVILQKRCK